MLPSLTAPTTTSFLPAGSLCIAVETGLERLRLHAKSDAGALHDAPARGGAAAHEERDADDAFVAGHGELRRCALRRHVEQRDDGRHGKVDMLHRGAGIVEHLAERHVGPLEIA
jgi:hypothetical protein